MAAPETQAHLPALAEHERKEAGHLLQLTLVELIVLAWLRHVFFQTSFARSFLSVTVGGAIITALSAGLGIAAS